ncbi:MAG: hypothetical protein ACI4DK_13355 [Lachnospiraceae bacterium]
MIEFVGSKEILSFAKEEGFKTIRMTFEDNTSGRDFNVYEISEGDFEKMCIAPDEEWEDKFGWWRYAEGCSLEGSETIEIIINNHPFKAWYNEWKLRDYFDENSNDGDISSVYDEWMEDHSEYSNLFEYCIDMFGASTETNITAIAVGLAKLNNMSLADLCKLSIEM